MNQELEQLIDFALADGVLTEKKKEILYKKAKELNVDQDEFEMVLEGKVFLKQKEMQAQAPVQPQIVQVPVPQVPQQPATPQQTAGSTINTILNDVTKVESEASMFMGLKNMLGL